MLHCGKQVDDDDGGSGGEKNEIANIYRVFIISQALSKCFLFNIHYSLWGSVIIYILQVIK